MILFAKVPFHKSTGGSTNHSPEAERHSVFFLSFFMNTLFAIAIPTYHSWLSSSFHHPCPIQYKDLIGIALLRAKVSNHVFNRAWVNVMDKYVFAAAI